MKVPDLPVCAKNFICWKRNIAILFSQEQKLLSAVQEASLKQSHLYL